MICCFSLSLLDATACRAWWLRRLHPAGPACPACGVALCGVSTETWASDGLVHCRSCGKCFDNRTGTPLCGTHIDWRQLTLLATLLAGGMKPSRIAVHCRISVDTVHRITRRIMGDSQ
ncbi:MAG: hypothetical protein ABSA86_07295 [Oryzomonas sp.]